MQLCFLVSICKLVIGAQIIDEYSDIRSFVKTCISGALKLVFAAALMIKQIGIYTTSSGYKTLQCSHCMVNPSQPTCCYGARLTPAQHGLMDSHCSQF